MVYLTSIESFVEAATKLFSDSPGQTRYTLKFDRKDNHVILKVTDNKTCVKYKCTEAGELQRINEHNMKFLHLCAEKPFDQEELDEFHQKRIAEQKEAAEAAAAEKLKRKLQQQAQQGGQGKKKKK
eukprot:TRINITY_DN349_c0_g1_i1.p2 TRINITY_DN349_c0_g1~~TRINITY_DN349_c0_g1_i1.p2  ORF type:complete len:126 (+),score=71.58 TRINITY_DN349_c0_g1_i1:45-422(+)